jgi:hypothetical protein
VRWSARLSIGSGRRAGPFINFVAGIHTSPSEAHTFFCVLFPPVTIHLSNQPGLELSGLVTSPFLTPEWERDGLWRRGSSGWQEVPVLHDTSLFSFSFLLPVLSLDFPWVGFLVSGDGAVEGGRRRRLRLPGEAHARYVFFC